MLHFSPRDAFQRRLTASLLTFLLSVAVLSGSSAAQSLPTPERASEKSAVAAPPLPAGSWRFIVSGDSRNCGDIIVPAIAAHSAEFAPTFYWHLGDLRAIYKVDEDMAFEAATRGQVLSCEVYERRAWNDFVENQIAAFGSVPFYVGIGNHEVIPPKTEEAFTHHFRDWLDQPSLRSQDRKSVV